jgi:hypothetical protein
VALRHKLRASNAVARVAAAEVVEELKKKTSSTPLGAEASEPGTRGAETSSASPSSHATPTAPDAKEEKREEGKRGEEKEKKRTTVAPPAPTPVRASPRRAANKNKKAEEDAAPAAPPPAPIAGLSPVAGVVSGKSPVRSSPRLRAAALAAGSNAPEPNERSAEDEDFRFAAHPARGSARRAPARGATTKTPSRLGNAFFSAEEDSAAKRERDEARRSATPASTKRRLPSGDAETDAPSPRRNEPEAGDEPETNRKRAEAVPEPERVETLGRKSPRRGLTRGGARRVLISDSGAGAEARDVPGLPTPGSDAAARVPSPLLLGARSTGKSSVKSSGVFDLERVCSEETEQTEGAAEGIAAEGIAADGGAHSAAGRSVRTRSASRRAARPPPPKDLTVPVSPAITRASKRSRAGAFPSEKTSEELDLERSLAAAAAERAKRQRRVAPAEGSGAVSGLGARSKRARGDARGEKSRVGSKTRAVSVAFGGRVRAPEKGDTKETKRVAPPDEAAPRGARPVTVPRSPHLSGARGDRFFSARAKTSEELELEKIAAVPKFRARPLTRSVLQGQDGAAEKAAAAAKKKREAAALVAKGKAKPAPFDATVGRARSRDERDAERAECAARDAKRARLASEAEAFGFAGAVPPTAPESPAFATARRAALRAPFLESDGGGSGVFARTTTTRGARRVAASDVDGPSAFGTESLASDRFGRVDGVTCPAPFALATDRRGEAAKAELEFRLEQRARLEAERARAAAKARPVPKTSSRACRGRLPEPVFKPPTSTEPFRLRGEALSAYEKKRERERAEKEKEEEEKRRRFAAKPLPEATFRTVFAVRRSDKPLTTPAEDVLAAGARRAAERAAFDAEVAELAKHKEEELAETRRLEAEAEAKARKALRKSTRFVAAPMPDYDALASVGVAPVAERALTRPESPPLRTNRRASRWG